MMSISLRVSPGRKVWSRNVAVAFLTAAAALCLGQNASAGVRRYYCNVELRSGEIEHRCEMPANKIIDGGYTEVVTDSLGRIIRTDWYWGAEKKEETRYHYPGSARLPDSIENYTSTGELAERLFIKRNAAGDRIRTEVYSSTGQLTSYSVRTLSADSVESVSYNADGKWTGRTVAYYSAAGVLIRVRRYPEEAGTTVYETEIDPSDGNNLSQKKYVGSALDITTKFAYTPYGDLVREDLYDPDGKWYAMKEYSADQVVSEKYQFKNGATEEIRITYDGNRRTKSTIFYYNAQLICTFTYDRLPTGEIKRTLAVASDGTLMAEYPDLFVDKVERTGHPVDHPNAGTIYKKNNWW